MPARGVFFCSSPQANLNPGLSVNSTLYFRLLIEYNVISSLCNTANAWRPRNNGTRVRSLRQNCGSSRTGREECRRSTAGSLDYDFSIEVPLYPQRLRELSASIPLEVLCDPSFCPYPRSIILYDMLDYYGTESYPTKRSTRAEKHSERDSR